MDDFSVRFDRSGAHPPQGAIELLFDFIEAVIPTAWTDTLDDSPGRFTVVPLNGLVQRPPIQPDYRDAAFLQSFYL
jgi:hypothetical protein